MDMRSNTNVFHRVIEEGFNRGNFDAWDDCFPPNYEEHQYGQASTLAGFKQAIAGLRKAIPDLHLTIDDMVTDGEKVWARMTARGTQLGPYMGFAPTGSSPIPTRDRRCWPAWASCISTCARSSSKPSTAWR